MVPADEGEPLVRFESGEHSAGNAIGKNACGSMSATPASESLAAAGAAFKVDDAEEEADEDDGEDDDDEEGERGELETLFGNTSKGKVR